MARMHVIERSKSQMVMDDLHKAVERRLAVSSLAPCPVEFTSAFVGMCATQSCGKCTPCRIGLMQLKSLMDDVLENRADDQTLELIERSARTIYLSSDCAIGYEAGEMALIAIKGFRDDFEHHISKHSCGFVQSELVPCVSGCPAGVDIPGYIALVEAGRNSDAVRLIRKDNPLPVVCGLVCEHPCEMHCRRGMVDDPMNIRGLKRYATEHMEYSYRPRKADATQKHIAIIGGGPAGLSAAYYLSLMGHQATIFEARHQLGGMLRYGIPPYRLPRNLLDAEINWVVEQGIKVVCDRKIDTSAFQQLADSYDGLYIAIGAHQDRKLGLAGEDNPAVISAVQMLRNIGDNHAPDFTAKRICVIGGGNVAMDAARSAVRLGASHVQVVYRRRISDMTAQDEEIVGCQAEGCEILQLQKPLSIECDNKGMLKGVLVQPQIIGGPQRGRPAPRDADSDPLLLEADIVIVAIGQSIESAPFEQLGIKTDRGRIVCEADGSVPGFSGLFCGGDCQSGPATVIRAINAGKVAAGNIDSYLGYEHKINLDVEIPTVQFRGKVACARCDMTLRNSKERIKDFDGIELGLTDEEAHQEASRCLRCDHFGFGALRGGRVEQW